MSVSDSYFVPAAPRSARYTVQRSRFLAFVEPVRSVEEAEETVALYRKEYYDATHVCWAYAVGPGQAEQRTNDDGEPSGTAGRPILGQILSHGLSDVLLLVVRYYGGIKLGTSGLIDAYKISAELALEEIPTREVILCTRFGVRFAPSLTGEVMRVLKVAGANIVGQDFSEGESAIMVEIRQANYAELVATLRGIYGVTVLED